MMNPPNPLACISRTWRSISEGSGVSSPDPERGEAILLGRIGELVQHVPLSSSATLYLPRLQEYLLKSVKKCSMGKWIIAALVGIALLAQGCSELEPRHGTKVTVAFDTPKPIRRDQLAAISKYLVARGRHVLDVRGPRVQSYTGYSLTLLLPGKRVSKARAEKLIQSYSIELYHLTSVATPRHPDRPWKITVPAARGGPYLFVGPNARLIDSRKDPAELRDEILGKSKPILTGRDILPNASLRQVRDGWAVWVHFDKTGAQAFFAFTKANTGEYLAVFYNGRLVSAPIIKQSIPGGEALITGFAQQEQAEALDLRHQRRPASGEGQDNEGGVLLARMS